VLSSARGFSHDVTDTRAIYWSRVSSVSTVTELWPGQARDLGSIPENSKKASTMSASSSGFLGLFCGFGSEIEYYSLLSAEDKNLWSLISIHMYMLIPRC
jgi:hypothetical protein